MRKYVVCLLGVVLLSTTVLGQPLLRNNSGSLDIYTGTNPDPSTERPTLQLSGYGVMGVGDAAPQWAQAHFERNGSAKVSTRSSSDLSSLVGTGYVAKLNKTHVDTGPQTAQLMLQGWGGGNARAYLRTTDSGDWMNNLQIGEGFDLLLNAGREEVSGTFGNVSVGTRLGVGVEDPWRRLTVKAQGSDGVLVSGNGTGDPQFKLTNDFGGQHFIFSDNSMGNKLTIESENALKFNTNGNNERMRIGSGGNVGIGTTDPADELHVKGQNELLNLQAEVNNSYLTFNDSANAATVGQYKGGSNPYFYISQGYTSGFPALLIDDRGFTGIGTPSPAKQLEVQGSGLRVSDNTSSHITVAANDSQNSNRIRSSGPDRLNIHHGNPTSGNIEMQDSAVGINTFANASQTDIRLGGNTTIAGGNRLKITAPGTDGTTTYQTTGSCNCEWVREQCFEERACVGGHWACSPSDASCDEGDTMVSSTTGECYDGQSYTASAICETSVSSSDGSITLRAERNASGDYHLYIENSGSGSTTLHVDNVDTG